MLTAKDYTDRRPQVLTGQFTAESHRALNLNTCTKSEIRASFENSYNLNDSLFSSLNDESVFYKCPDRLRLPLVFYYGHTAAVYVNKLVLAGLLKERINLEFETIFETGVDEMSWDDTENYRMGGSYQWPSLDEVVEYRRLVRATILEIIDKTPLQLPITMESPWWALLMGIDHERIHVETSAVLIRQLPVTMVQRRQGFCYAPFKHDRGVTSNPMIKVKGGDVVFGKPVNFPSYGWDNEYGRVEASVPDFECSKHLVTNRQFLKFVHDGGYQRRELWSEEGWEWVQYRKSRHPVFWVCQKGCKSGCGSDLASYSHCHPSRVITADDVPRDSTNNGRGRQFSQNGQHSNGFSNGQPVGDTTVFYDHQEKFRYRAMFDVLELPFDWPVEVNHLEAKAYCRWLGAGYRLPTEAEYQCIRETRDTTTGPDRLFLDGNDSNIDLKYFSSSPVNLYRANTAGFTDCHGNVWQWLEDDFNGFPGFKNNRYYEDYSIPCFEGKHSIIVGGSWVSTAALASTFSRYGFRRHFIQFAGFRVCRNTQPPPIKLPVRFVRTSDFGDMVPFREPPLDPTIYHYEPVPTTNPGLLEENRENAVKILSRDYQPGRSLAERSHEMMTSRRIPIGKVLLVGCETGRLAFDLSKFFTKVIAVDHCGTYIDIAEGIRTDGIYGQIQRPRDSNPDRITFKQFTWLPNEVGIHHLVIFNNIDRVMNIRAYTVRLPELVVAGGLLVIASRKQQNGDHVRALLQQHFSPVEVFNDADVIVTVLRRNDVK